MAGTSKSYWRLKNPSAPVQKTGINSYGKSETYYEWDLYHYNHAPGSHVMDGDGKCTSNPGMDAEYYTQGPEKGAGGQQINHPSVGDKF